ncbi:MAG: PD-(D/E)XK nuclease family transposase [Gammaproteobacteria bacterium]|nr:PD-(D/E)XK nuclease family transposase [Gammaproteobacteria bacterium]
MPHSHYINLFTDFGFKKIFGEEQSKPNLISFLNTLLPPKHHIAELTFNKSEQLGASVLDRKAIFDLNCISDSACFSSDYAVYRRDNYPAE